MDVNLLTVPREEAVKMLHKYQSHLHNQKAPTSELDREIALIYKTIADGKMVINALDSIVKAGLGEDNLPRLAIARADVKTCFLTDMHEGSATMSATQRIATRADMTKVFRWPRDTFPGIGVTKRGRRYDAKAMVPHIPPDIRPKRGLANYHVLWEAEWRPTPPVDPMLLRRIGKTGDIWMVMGVWNLTDVERAVMAMHQPRS